MDRRALLAAAGACLSGLAGCGSTDPAESTDGATATTTPTETPTRTPTATVEPTTTPLPTRVPPERRYEPQLLDVALVSTWSEPGDLSANRIESVRRGQPAVLAYRYRVRVPQGTINLKEGVDVLDGDDLVVRRSRDIDRYVESAGLHTWEDATTFDTSEWPVGELTATVAVGELQLHRVSNRVSTTFEVTAP
jgi:hypothetical protein